ncbi:glycosyl hydrolase [Histoplasma capsulatum var. duboisii H88]|uniref:Glycosyl hydrolase n=1 Tax=Ajellomyces capsulatus (strain H88) TaxID=544711 RepID=F0UKM2_AJEC8|nr:glycosyl hydrolase [Histoplasma capsulatum var. duboisii H88]QSS56607.1 glycosyl hydrolase [Histoplasma capsulatum var. duboisii H88]
MRSRLRCPRKGLSPFSLIIITVGVLLCLSLHDTALAQPLENSGYPDSDGRQKPLNDPAMTIPLSASKGSKPQKPIHDPNVSDDTLKKLLNALDVMQSSYFETWQGTWPSSIDWTAAVLGTHVSATLSSLSINLHAILDDHHSAAAGGSATLGSHHSDVLAYENLINYYFLQLSTFYFGEDAFSLRMQAYDDMLWVVLGWLENIKFQKIHSGLHYSSYSNLNDSLRSSWYGTQLRRPAAHRARLFYDLASNGWNTSLCSGGMIWSPYLEPYKNAITNELFISASIGMYLHFPGDDIDSPLLSESATGDMISKPHNPTHLNAAVAAYDWLKNSNMTDKNGLYADGFHIQGWRDKRNPGTRKCDVLDTMVYTYNQGVLLSGLRDLWLATGAKFYLEDGHQLVENVIKATGWPNTSIQKWHGLGRAGVLEDACDSSGSCSQNGQTFKSIFFHHFTEFCRPLINETEKYFSASTRNQQTAEQIRSQRQDYEWHQEKCSSYYSWVAHNANASYMTKDEKGKFGMWWGRPYPYSNLHPTQTSPLPDGAVDFMNADPFADVGDEPHRRMLKSADGNIYFGGYRKSPFVKNKKIERISRPSPRQQNTAVFQDVNDRGRGRTVETQSGAVAVLRALYQWEMARKQ